MSRLLGLSALFVVLTFASAAAEREGLLSKVPPGTWIGDGPLKMVATPPEQFLSSPPFEVSNVLYLNRCSGGCTVTGGTINDARNHITTYIAPGPHVIAEYENLAGDIGTAADSEWNAVVQCIKEIYSPFNVVITDQKPTGAGNYTEAIIAGVPEDAGLDSTMVLGVAPAHTSCEPNDNALSYSFANHNFYRPGMTLQNRIWKVCSVVGQESAHHYGLDHSFEYFDGASACNDPMTYRTDCGGQKFFRNKAAKCGEFMGVRECSCGGLQNTHAKILGVFGVGPQLLIPPPTASITAPSNNGTASAGQVVNFAAGSKRGIEKSELWLNGYMWASVKGLPFGSQGQPNPGTYNLMFPSGVPDSVIDIQIIAYDDLGVSTTSSTVRVTKGAACTSAATCAKGQACDGEGRCFWEAPVGELGDTCEYNQFCVSNSCVETSDGSFCASDCIVGADDACPMDFECVAGGDNGVCLLKAEEGGCPCGVTGNRRTRMPWAQGGVALFVLAFVLRRRRKR